MRVHCVHVALLTCRSDQAISWCSHLHTCRLHLANNVIVALAWVRADCSEPRETNNSLVAVSIAPLAGDAVSGSCCAAVGDPHRSARSLHYQFQLPCWSQALSDIV